MARTSTPFGAGGPYRRTAVPPRVPQEALRAVFSLIEAAVESGDRCPTIADIANHLLPLDIQIDGCAPSDITLELARRGEVEFLMYPQQYRVAILRVGGLAGRQTAGPPYPRWRPLWRVWVNGWEKMRESRYRRV